MSKIYKSKLIIADTSCLILLSKIEELELLKKLFKEIIVTSEIVEEYGEKLPNWFVIKSVVNKQKQIIFESQVDRGEASAIALSFEMIIL
jgi:predicted nucleic acid-binding protein